MGGEWQKWIGAILLALVAWYFWRNRKGVFARADFGKSFRVMGVLAIILFVFIALLVYLARH